MKYKCTHCNHIFELSERDFQRCPDCFWTTSLVALEGSATKEILTAPKPENASPPKRFNFPGKFILAIAVLALSAVAVIVVQKGGLKDLKETHPSPKPIKPADISKALSAEEKAVLAKAFQITIPRQVTEDEEEILKKQMIFPAKLSEKPVIVPWNKKDFEKMISTEQKSRKIQLGWGYVKSLIGTFQKNYPNAVKTFEQGDYALARDQFLRSLSFPVYRNNQQTHRAVVLVMLRPYINDVIGKIAVLNQYLVGQSYLSEVNSIFANYQMLFPVIELQEWDKALGMITNLKNQINAFEQKPKDNTVVYPPFFAALDQEIQNVVLQEAAPKPEAVVNLKPFMVDLDLKEKVVRSNTANELSGIQKRYQQALTHIEQGSWQEAGNILRSIEFPPELVEDAKTKLEIIDKIMALNETN